jgi:hypothetical protein
MNITVQYKHKYIFIPEAIVCYAGVVRLSSTFTFCYIHAFFKGHPQ